MNVYLARQPIYSIDKTPAAFELLYRDSDKNVYNTEMDGNQSTRAVITHSLFMFDLEKLTQNKPAFVNFTRDLILEKVPMLLNSNNFTIEILEDVELDEPLIERLAELKQAGFTLALDDYAGAEIPDKALSLIDIIKVDFLLTSQDMRKKIAMTFLPKKKKLLAEKIETKEDFEYAVKTGYELFQGYYFSKPIMLQSKRKDIASTSYFKLMKELTAEELNYKKLSEIIYTDAHLTYHLLKKMNSLQYYRAHTVKSVEMALAHMGENEIRRWITLLLMRNVAGEGMDNLIRTGLIRAVFCECMAKKILGGFSETAFTLGMFSIISREDKNFFNILESLKVSDVLQSALQGEHPLGVILELAELYEAGEWKQLKAVLNEQFPEAGYQNLAAMYMAAVNYADNVFALK